MELQLGINVLFLLFILGLLLSTPSNCVYIRPTKATSTVKDKIEHMPSWMAKKNRLSLVVIGKPELVHFLSCRDESVKMANSTLSPTKSAKYLGVHLDENLTFEDHVQSVLGKMAKHVSVVMRLRRFCESSKVVRFCNTYKKPIIQYGLLVYGCTRKSKLKGKLLLQKSTSSYLFQKPNISVRYLFKRSSIMNVYDHCVCDLLKNAVYLEACKYAR